MKPLKLKLTQKLSITDDPILKVVDFWNDLGSFLETKLWITDC